MPDPTSVAGPGEAKDRRADSRADSGIYLVLLELPAAIEATVGGLGAVRLGAGRHVYVGSARRNLRARVERHLRPEKPVRWHIDYLTTREDVRVVGAVLAAGPADECRLSRSLSALPGAEAPVPRFGAGDCAEGCAAHLWRVGHIGTTPDVTPAPPLDHPVR